MNGITLCCYCKQPRQFSLDLHGCPESLVAMKRLDAVIEVIIGIQLDRKPKLITK
ncbi:hypothetical protein [Arthrobacter sp. NicSoilC5]|uniref:hypothetical protein n=1 Tax=Arthrobacter sp. NicSoilC5 TaxID=2831000 RepID=UPI001CC6E438|nr:hypothetical protein [Arthrobacter sp. NicSoilC5]BCW78300.1 hypothetical protein NicSoilC5_03190 [Arthrobacter sp. NicSoilC5]